MCCINDTQLSYSFAFIKLTAILFSSAHQKVVQFKVEHQPASNYDIKVMTPAALFFKWNNLTKWEQCT